MGAVERDLRYGDVRLEGPRRGARDVAQRRALRVEAIRPYECRAGRRARTGVEPNDRRHDSDVEQAVSGISPFDLAGLLGEDLGEGSGGLEGGE